LDIILDHSHTNTVVPAVALIKNGVSFLSSDCMINRSAYKRKK